jgi:DNA-binding LytR/AlgR family response regulator
MKIRSLIIDDEPLAIKVIENYLKEFEDVQVVQTFNNALDALNFLKDENVDLIFLDINMPLLDGLSFIQVLEDKPAIVITSAHKEFAVETYELDVLGYLVKPISFPRFVKSINRAIKAINGKKHLVHDLHDRPHIFVKVDKKKLQKIFLDEILVVESLKDYLKINTLTNKYIIHQTLSSFTSQLPDNFIRIHRSYTISLDKVDVVEGNSLEIDGIRYTIGRTYIEEVKSKILKP